MGHAPAIKHGQFTCSGDGLKFGSYPRASIYELRLQTGLSPVLTRTGRVAKKQRFQKQSLPWWEAQLHLYGLNPSVRKRNSTFKTALEKGLTVPKDLEQLEKRLNKEYHLAEEAYQKEIVERHEKEWFTLESDAQRARHDLGRFLREIVVDVKLLMSSGCIQSGRCKKQRSLSA